MDGVQEETLLSLPEAVPAPGEDADVLARGVIDHSSLRSLLALSRSSKGWRNMVEDAVTSYVPECLRVRMQVPAMFSDYGDGGRWGGQAHHHNCLPVAHVLKNRSAFQV